MSLHFSEQTYCPLTGDQPTLLRPFRPEPEEDFRPLVLVATLTRHTTDEEAAGAVAIGKAVEWMRETDGRVTIWGHAGKESGR